MSSFLFVGKYSRQTEDYWRRTNKNLADLEKASKKLSTLTEHRHYFWKKPKPLMLCADGFERHLPNYNEADVFTISLPETKNRSNLLLPNFCDIDWVFIISLPLSFIAILFTYNSFCGERQTGTLRLMKFSWVNTSERFLPWGYHCWWVF